MKIFTLFFILIVTPINLLGLVDEKKSMKVLMLVACFPKLHNVSVMNQITGLIDRGHDVTIYSFSKGDFVNVQKDVIKYDLIHRMISVLPDNLDEYDVVMFQMGHKLFNIRETHNYKGKIELYIKAFILNNNNNNNKDSNNYYTNSNSNISIFFLNK